MDAARRDYFRQGHTLKRQLGALLVVGVLVSWLMAHASSSWLELLCTALLMACSFGLFIVSARLFTRHHPAISLFNDRLWFRGLREQVVMLRHVSDAQLVETRIAGFTRRAIALQLTDVPADEPEHVQVPLDAVEVDPIEMLELIRERAALQRELQPAR
jgi:hypothetical protein